MKKPWERWEEDVQDTLGLSSTIGSGNKFYDPSDGIDKLDYTQTDFRLMVDAKCTKHSSYRLEKELLSQWVEKSSSMGYRFALPVRFSDGEGSDTDYVVCTLEDFSELVSRYREKDVPTTRKVAPFTERERDLIVRLADRAPRKVAEVLSEIEEKMGRSFVEEDVK